MRLLHTSDWHLGRSLHRADLGPAQAAFFDHLVDTTRAERVDVVLVAGDVYDRAVPSLAAVELGDEVLARLHGVGARVVMISGNHDSARRLGCHSSLVDMAGVHVRTRVSGLAEPVTIPDGDGPVHFYGVPYLEPNAVRDELAALAAGVGDRAGAPGPGPGAAGERAAAGCQPAGHAAVLRRATAAVRADLARRGGGRSVVLAHAWVTGGAVSGSERDISVGGVGCVPAGLFAGFTYTALGHLHAPQVLADGLRYSGSPLPYSFGEATSAKSSWLVELDATGLVAVERVPAPVHRRLSVVRDRLDVLLTAPVYADLRDDFLSVALTDPARPEGAMERLQQRFPHVLVLTWEPGGAGDDEPGSYGSRVRGRDDISIATSFVEHVRRSPATPAERELLTAAVDAGRHPDTDRAGVSAGGRTLAPAAEVA